MFSKGTVSSAVLQGSRHAALDGMFARGRNTIVVALLALMTSVITSFSVAQVGVAQAPGGVRQAKDSSDNRNRRPTPQQIAEFEQRMEKLFFGRLQATEDQQGKLRALKKRLDVEKTSLFRDEGDFRRAMRTELTAATPSEAKLAELLDRWPGLQRRRIDIQEREQRELAKFLTPLQRARFFSFEDELRRARQETQWGRDGRGGRGGPPGGMPGMRGDSTGGKRNSDFRGGGRGSKPPGKDTVIRK